MQQEIARRKQDGSEQWQDGYPNLQSIQNEVEKGQGFVLTEGETVIGYSAVILNDEPEYAKIKGEWLSNDDFVAGHRVALSENYLGKGLAKKILEYIE